MIADVILGNNIDTLIWIKELKEMSRENIVVVDYEFIGEPLIIDGVKYLSNTTAKEFLKSFDSVCFYKSMYIYPGMNNFDFSRKLDE